MFTAQSPRKHNTDICQLTVVDVERRVLFLQPTTVLRWKMRTCNKNVCIGTETAERDNGEEAGEGEREM